MGDDPLAQFPRTSPVVPAAPRPREPDEYIAFVGKDRPQYLEIRRAMAPYHSPQYTFYLNVSFDGPFGTNFVVYFSFMTISVRGRNLQEVIFAIQNKRAVYIQEFDHDRWSEPKNDKAPFIESIVIDMQGSSAETPDHDPTTH